MGRENGTETLAGSRRILGISRIQRRDLNQLLNRFNGFSIFIWAKALQRFVEMDVLQGTIGPADDACAIEMRLVKRSGVVVILGIRGVDQAPESDLRE